MLNAPQKDFQQRHVEDRLGDGQLRSRLNFVFEASDLFVKVEHTWVGAHADHKAGAVFSADCVGSDIQTSVQIVDNVDQPDGIHVKHRGSIRIVSQLGRIAGDAQNIFKSYRGRA